MKGTFWIYVGILIVSLSAGHIYLYFNKRRYPTATDIDKLIWRIHVMSNCVGFAIYLFTIFLPLGGSYHETFSREDTPQEINRKLIQNDKDNTERLNTLQDALYVLIVALALHLMMTGNDIKKIQAKRNMQLLSEDPELKSPIGL